MDRSCHHADSEASYREYFELLQAKIRKYDVEARHIYNMDEKGFAVGITKKTKRVFSKTLF
jgi:O-acetylhomoserine/O-acetylserine sulfhydrylase-like pyridoxal-dependent enzyme